MDNITLGVALALAKKLGADPELVTAAVEAWLDAHPEATTTVEDGSITKAKLDQILQGIVDDVPELKSAINDINDDLYDVEEKTATTTADNYRLNESDGFCSYNGSYKLVKYSVSAGERYRIVSDDRFQFQTVASVPTAGTSNRVGETYGAGAFDLTVPQTATYLIVSTTKANSNASVSSVSSAVDEINGKTEQNKNAIDVLRFATEKAFDSEYGIVSLLSNFVRGGLANGILDKTKLYRIASTEIIHTDAQLTLTIASGFRLNRHVFVDGSYSTTSGFQTGTITIPADRYFKIEIARSTENTSEQADVNTFAEQVTFKTGIQSQIDGLNSDISSLDSKIDDKTGFVEYITDPNWVDDTNIVENTTWQSGYYRGTSGNASSTQYTTNYIASDFIPVVPGFKYLVHVSGTCGIVAEYYSDAKNDGTEENIGTVTYGVDKEITIPSGKTFVAFNCSMNASNKVSTMFRMTQYESEKQVCIPKLAYGTQEWIGKKIVNFGDSIIGAFRPPVDVSTFIAQRTGATVYNCGFGGCRMGYHTAPQFDAFSMYRLADAIASGDWSLQESALSGDNIPSYYEDTLELLESIDFSAVDIITIAYGTNDFAGGLRLGTDDFYATDYALKYSIETILTTYPNVRIFVCVPMYRVWLDESTHAFVDDSNTHEVTSWAGGNVYKLTDFVQAERNVCKETQTPVIDNYYDLGINKWNWIVYFPATDGTHPNETGRKLLAEHIASEIW